MPTDIFDKVATSSQVDIFDEVSTPKKGDIFDEILQHPFKAIFNPIAKTLTGKSFQDRALESTAPVEIKPNEPRAYWSAFGKNALSGMGGSVADIATTPATYVPIPGLKLLGKIPVKGTTLGEAVSKIPFKQLGAKDWGQVIKNQELLKKIPIPKIDVPVNIENISIDDIADKLKASGMKKEQFDMLSGSIQAEGIKVPIIVDEATGNVLDGQHRVFVASKLGIKDIPAIKVDGSKITDDGLDTLSKALNDKYTIPSTPVQKITQALKEATPVRDVQEELYSAERAKRIAKVSEIGKGDPTQAGFYKQLGALKGELPKAQFKSISDKVSQPDIDSLFKDVQNSPLLDEWDKIPAKHGLNKLLGIEYGGVPTEGELHLLSQVFPPEFIATVLEKRPLIEKFSEGLGEVLNFPRAIMSTADLSAPLRQGIFFVGKPKQFLPSFGNMFKYFFDEKSYQGLLDDIRIRPTYQLMKEARLPLTDIKAPLSMREEAFMSRLPEKIPLFGNVYKASNRAYNGFLNKLRADVFDDLIKKAELSGTELTPKVLKNIGEFIGNATGRGSLPDSLKSSAPLLNGIFFSPRLMASRLNLMNPVTYTKLDPFTRKEALKSLFTFSATAGSVLGLASLGGAQVGQDPRSADFGKIKLGNTRYDVLGGFQQYIRLASQLITGESVSSTTGVKMTLGEGYKPVTRLDILGRFLQTKENPITSFVTDILKGKTFEGENVDLTKAVADRFVPMVLQDMTELYAEKGLAGVGMSMPAIFGVGVQTYTPTPSELVYSSKSIRNYSKKLMQQGKTEEGMDFYNDNKEIVEIGKQLEPMQKIISDLNRKKEYTKKFVGYSVQKKKELIFEYDKAIKDIEDQMEIKAKELQKK